MSAPATNVEERVIPEVLFPLACPFGQLVLSLPSPPPERVFVYCIDEKVFWTETVWNGCITETELRLALQEIADSL